MSCVREEGGYQLLWEANSCCGRLSAVVGGHQLLWEAISCMMEPIQSKALKRLGICCLLVCLFANG